MSIRTGRYRKSFFTKSELAEFLPQISQILQTNEDLFQQRKLSEVELVAKSLIELRQLKAKNWYSGKVFSGNYLDFFANSQLRGVPDSVNRAILKWHSKEYPLLLLKSVPTPLQVLKIQSHGLRCVSLVTDPAVFKDYILGERDVFSFTIHDLIHADHFFQRWDWRQAQIGFYKWVLSFYEQDYFQQLLNADSQFKINIDYVSSDMNSHPVHLVKTLKAHLDHKDKSLWQKLAFTSSIDNHEHLFEELKRAASAQDYKKNGVTLRELGTI